MPLGSNGNVWNTCLRILRIRGFMLEVEGKLDPEDCWPTDATWIAEKEGFRFMADNPIELLGLVGIYEYAKPREDAKYWWHVDGEDIWDEVMRKAFPDPPINEQSSS